MATVWDGSPLAFITFVQLYGKEPHTINRSRFKLAEYDQATGRYLRSPPGPQQLPQPRR